MHMDGAKIYYLDHQPLYKSGYGHRLNDCLNSKWDASMERFMFRHRVWGFCMMFIAMPIITLAAVCTCTMMVVLPMALVCGWI